MKTNFVLRQWFLRSAAVMVSVAFAASASAQSQTNKLRVGVYDSRAVAIAYGNSPAFQKRVASAQADFTNAKESKDDKAFKAIEARMKLLQRRLHEQAFSTGSVAAIMATVKDSLPTVAKKARVQLIVSKWEMNYQSPDVEVVDVTADVAALFQPSEKVLGWLKDLDKQPPVPIDEITDDLD